VKAVRPAFNLYLVLFASVVRRESGSLGLTRHAIDARPVSGSVQWPTFLFTGMVVPPLALPALPDSEMSTVSEKESRFQRRDVYGGLNRHNG